MLVMKGKIKIIMIFPIFDHFVFELFHIELLHEQ